MQNEIRYWAYRGFEEKALRKGSFIHRNSWGECDKFSDGHWVGTVDEIDTDQYSPVETGRALELMPRDLSDRFSCEDWPPPAHVFGTTLTVTQGCEVVNG